MARHETSLGYMANNSKSWSWHKVQEEYEALAQSHGSTIQRTPGPKRGLTAWVPNAKWS